MQPGVRFRTDVRGGRRMEVDAWKGAAKCILEKVLMCGKVMRACERARVQAE